METLAHIVTLDALLRDSRDGAYQPIVKKMPEGAVKWSFEQLLQYMVSAETDEYNPYPLNLGEQNLADEVKDYLMTDKEDPNVALQLFVPDYGLGIEGPFALQEIIEKSTSFSLQQESLDDGAEVSYLGLHLRASLYDIGG